MIEPSRKHGAFDTRWATPPEWLAARSSALEAEQNAALSEEAWETDGGAPGGEPVGLRAAVA
jgi:hypothetical protein